MAASAADERCVRMGADSSVVRCPRMALARHLIRAGRVVLLLAALVGVFAGSAILGLRLALRAREVPVPILVGQSVADATTALEAEGLSIRVDPAHREQAGVEPGHIAQQDPEGGASTRRPRAVRVWLKPPARAVQAPDLVGTTDRAARIRLDQLGLPLDEVATLPDERPAGTVIAQWPAARTAADRVRLAVSGGPGSLAWSMPELTGEEATGAVALLKTGGLKPTVTSRRRTGGATAGQVAAQQPAAGSPAAAPDTITLEVWK